MVRNTGTRASHASVCCSTRRPMTFLAKAPTSTMTAAVVSVPRPGMRRPIKRSYSGVVRPSTTSKILMNAYTLISSGTITKNPAMKLRRSHCIQPLLFDRFAELQPHDNGPNVCAEIDEHSDQRPDARDVERQAEFVSVESKKGSRENQVRRARHGKNYSVGLKRRAPCAEASNGGPAAAARAS